MIGLDTNILIRLLTQDDARQLAAARRYVKANCTPEDPGFINHITLVEMVWVLETAYDDYTRSQIAAALDSLLNIVDFSIEYSGAVRAASLLYRDGADFADALVAALNGAQGCTATATFDAAAAKRIAHFSLIV